MPKQKPTRTTPAAAAKKAPAPPKPPAPKVKTTAPKVKPAATVKPATPKPVVAAKAPVKPAPAPKNPPARLAPPRGVPARPSAAKPAPLPPLPPEKGRKTAYTKTELEHFRKIILEKKKEILEELETLRDSMLDVTTGEYASESSMYSTHMEQGTDAMEREKTFLFASREGKFLNHLEDALQRIDRGEYGRCSECGKLIEKERLEAVPHAQQCLRCKMNLSK